MSDPPHQSSRMVRSGPRHHGTPTDSADPRDRNLEGEEGLKAPTARRGGGEAAADGAGGLKQVQRSPDLLGPGAVSIGSF